MPSHGQRAFLHRYILHDFCISEGLEPTPSNIQAVKQKFKDVLGIEGSSEDLDEAEYGRFISDVVRICAENFGHELPLSDSIKTMNELLAKIDKEYHEQRQNREV